MTHDEFMEIRSDLDKYCTKLLSTKAAEYAPGKQDRLCQFHKIATLSNTTPIQALLSLMAKHETSIHDYGKRANSYNLDLWREKIGDIRNYCDLLWALLSANVKEGELEKPGNPFDVFESTE